jgi:hypothetical protein
MTVWHEIRRAARGGPKIESIAAAGLDVEPAIGSPAASPGSEREKEQDVEDLPGQAGSTVSPDTIRVGRVGRVVEHSNSVTHLGSRRQQDVHRRKRPGCLERHLTPGVK